MGLYRRQQCLRIGEFIVHRLASAYRTGKVHQKQIGTAPTNFYAQGKSTIRIECHGHRGLSDASPQGLMANQQSVVFQSRGDQADGLGCETRQAGDFSLGQTTIQPNCMQHNPLVELAHSHVVGATRPQHGWGAHKTTCLGKGQGVQCVNKVHGRRVSPMTPLRSKKFPNGCCSPVSTIAKALLVRS